MSTLAAEQGSYLDPLSGVQGEPFTPLNSNPGTKGYVASLLVSSGAAVLFGFSGYNSGPAQWIMVFDLGAGGVPANGSTPEFIQAIAASSNFNQSWGTGRDGGRGFDRGIFFVNSTTSPTLTIGAANVWLDVQYL